MNYDDIKIMYYVNLKHNVNFKKELKKVHKHKHSYMGDVILGYSKRTEKYPDRPVDRIYEFISQFKPTREDLKYNHIRLLYEAKLKHGLDLNEKIIKRVDPFYNLRYFVATWIGDFIHNHDPVISNTDMCKRSILEFLKKYRIPNEKS